MVVFRSVMMKKRAFRESLVSRKVEDITVDGKTG
jgi:hypothetical protein